MDPIHQERMNNHQWSSCDNSKFRQWQRFYSLQHWAKLILISSQPIFMESTCELRTPKAPACASISPDPMATFESRFNSDANSGIIFPINTPVGRTSPRARCRNSVKPVDWISSSSQSPWTLPSTQSPAIHPHLQTNGQTDLALNPVNRNVKKSARSKARSMSFHLG